MITRVPCCGRLVLLIALTCAVFLPVRGAAHAQRLNGVRHRAHRRLRHALSAEHNGFESGATPSGTVVDERSPLGLPGTSFRMNRRSRLDHRGGAAVAATIGLWIAARQSIAPPFSAPVYLRRAALLI